MSDSQIVPGSSKGTGPQYGKGTYMPNPKSQTASGQSIDPGDPVTIYQPAPNQIVVAKARGNALQTSTVVGLALTPSENNNRPAYVASGPLTLPPEVWDTKVDELPRAMNTPYYLSAATAGLMTTTPPSSMGQFVTPLGFFTSDDTFQIVLGVPTAAGG